MSQDKGLLSSGIWVTPARCHMVAVLCFVVTMLAIGYLVLTADGNVDNRGRPLGTDFSNIYAAGTFVREGNPQAPFYPDMHYPREQRIFGEQVDFYGWHYPPFLLPVAGMLAAFPYGAALALWLGITFLCYGGMMWRLVREAVAALPEASRGRAFRIGLWLAVGFPAVFVNIGHGHNGFLSAALLGGGLWLLPTRPILAGVLFGLLVYKPQFGVLLPLALVAGGYWRAFLAAALTVCVLIAAVTALYGLPIWEAFHASTDFTREVVLEAGGTGWHKLQSVFAWLRMWHAPLELAYAAQIGLMLLLALAIWRLWRGTVPYALKAAALCLAAVLATPYLLDYDLVLLAPAVAFYAIDGLKRGFRPWEKTMLAGLWMMPLFARTFAMMLGLPIGVWLMLAGFVLLWRRSQGGLRG